YIAKVEYKIIEEQKCGQILHSGSFDNEPSSVKVLEEYLMNNDYQIKANTHHEIYLSDFRRVSKEKYQTLIRYQIKKLANSKE
ncbi:MAG: GyrI-like domain-containing protein, partial [Mycoplasmatales bacterium]